MNLLKQFFECVDAVEEHQTLGNVEHDGATAVLRQGYLSDDLLLGVRQSANAHTFLFEFVEHLPDELFTLFQILFIFVLHKMTFPLLKISNHQIYHEFKFVKTLAGLFGILDINFLSYYH